MNGMSNVYNNKYINHCINCHISYFLMNKESCEMKKKTDYTHYTW